MMKLKPQILLLALLFVIMVIQGSVDKANSVYKLCYSGCPEGWKMLENMCLKVYSKELLSPNEAQKRCQDTGVGIKHSSYNNLN